MKLVIVGKSSESDSPSIIGTYTFMFQGDTASAPSIRLVEANLDFCVGDRQKALKKGINALLGSIRNLQALPRHERRLGISPMYRQSCLVLYKNKWICILY